MNFFHIRPPSFFYSNLYIYRKIYKFIMFNNQKFLVKRGLFILFLFVFLFSFMVVSLEIDVLDNLTAENITFIGDENVTRYLNISKHSNVTNAVLNLSGFPSHYNISEYSDMFYVGEDGIYSVDGIYTNVSDFWVIGRGSEGNGTIARYDSGFNIIGSSKPTNRTFEDITGNGTDLWLLDTLSLGGLGSGGNNATGVVDRYDIDGNYLDGFVFDTTEFIDAMKGVSSSWDNTYRLNGIAYNGSDLWIMVSVYEYILTFESVMCAFSTEGVSLNHCITELGGLCWYDMDYNSNYFWCGADWSGKTIAKLNPDGSLSDSFVAPYNIEGIAMNGSSVFTYHSKRDHEIFEYDTSGTSLSNYSTLNISNSLTIDGMLATNGTSIWAVNTYGVVQEYNYDGSYIRNPKNLTLIGTSQSYGSLDWDGTYFWRFDRSNRSFYQYYNDWSEKNNWSEGNNYALTGITSNGTHLFGVFGQEYVLVYNFTGVTFESYFTLGDSSLDLVSIDYDEYEDVFWISDGSTIFKYYSNFTDTGITYDIPSYQQGIAYAKDIAVSEKGLLLTTQTNVYKHSFSYPEDPWLEIGTPDGTREWIHANEFNITNNKTSDFSLSINSYLTTCTINSEGYCLVPYLFHSDKMGVLEYSISNVTYDPHNITIIKNQTLPETPAINDEVFINVELNETVGFDINSVKFTITPPNGTAIYSDINGTYTKPDAGDLFYYNWSSQSFTIDDGGTWTWTYIAINNESGRADYSEVRETGSFLILDTTAPTFLGIDSPTNDTEYITTSDIDVNVSLSDDMRIDSWWFNIVNGSKPSQILQANTSFTYCGTTTCGNNISQFAFPIADNMTVNVWVNDTSGNEARGQIIKLNVTTDTSKVRISITNPSGAKTSYTIPIVFSITDNVAVDTCEWNITLAGVISNQSGMITNCTVDETITLYLQSETAYVFNVQSNDTNNNWEQGSSAFSIDLPEPPPPPPPPSGNGGSGGAPTCPVGELYDPLLFKCVPLIKLPENASNLTLTPSRLDKPSIAFTLITDDEALFKQDFKSNFRLSTVEVISGNFNVTIVGNTTIRMSLLLDKKTNWFSKVVEGSFSVTDMFGRTTFVDDIKVVIYNPAYRVIDIIPLLAFIPIALIVVIVFYKKREVIILGVKNVYTKFIRMVI